MKSPESTIQQWIKALNSGDIDALLAISKPDIAIAGPRGTSHGIEILRAWYMNTHLTLDVEQQLVHNDQVISVGIAHWHDTDGSELGTASTAFLMRVTTNGLVAELSRHDEGLSAALAESNVPNESDWRTVSI